MTDPKKPPYDDELDDELFGALVDALPVEAPAAALKDRLMKSVASESRFGDRFAAQMASIIDVAKEKAQALLDAIDDATRWQDNPLMPFALFHIDGGPRVANAVVGFVKMKPGDVFPEHKHVGDEIVLIIQGGYVDSAGVTHRAGEEHRMPAGSMHSFTAAPGPDLVYLGVVQEGFDIGEAHFGPDDPNA
jgi:quercetin dioxygenase-like cupin family protein